MMMARATAVAVGTANFADPLASLKVVEGIEDPAPGMTIPASDVKIFKPQ